MATVPPKTARIVGGFFLAFAALTAAYTLSRGISPLQSLLAVALMGCGLLTSWILYDTLLSPIGSFSVFWEGALYLKGLSLVQLTPIGPVALLLLHGSFVATVAASIVVGPSFARPSSLANERSIATTLVALGTAGIIVGLAEISLRFGLFGIFTEPTAVRIAVTNHRVGTGIPAYLALLMFPAAIMAARMRYLAVFALLVSATFAFLSTDRSYFFLVVAFLAVGSMFGPRTEVSARFAATLAGMLLASLVLFVSAGTVLGKEQLMINLMRGASSSSVLPSPAVAPYVYITGGFVAFSEYIGTVSPATIGIEAVITPLTRITKGHKENVFYEFRKIPFDFNLYTYLRSWYDAAGYLGVFVGPALYSAIAAIAYKRRPDSPAWYGVACVVTVGMLGGIFNPNLTTISFLFLIVFVAALPFGWNVSLRILNRGAHAVLGIRAGSSLRDE